MSEKRKLIYADDLIEEICKRKGCFATAAGNEPFMAWEIEDYINDAEPIDPETLPIVRELRGEIERLQNVCQEWHKQWNGEYQMRKTMEEKLARYEQAEKEERLVELPYRVGDTAYVIIQSRDQNMHVKIESRVWEIPLVSMDK